MQGRVQDVRNPNNSQCGNSFVPNVLSWSLESLHAGTIKARRVFFHVRSAWHVNYVGNESSIGMQTFQPLSELYPQTVRFGT